MIFVITILSILLAIHIAWSIYMIMQLRKTAQFSQQQKRMHIILILLVPYLWATLLYYMLKQLPESYKVDPQDRFTHTDFHESGKGSPGMRGF